MLNEQRLRHQITELQKQWDLLSKKLFALEEEKIVATNVEERFRLDHRIAQIKTERENIEQQLSNLESQLPSETQKTERNEKFTQTPDSREEERELQIKVTEENKDFTARIFLSYVQEDKEKVEEIYYKLRDAGFSPWMAAKDVLPGQVWNRAIKEAIQKSDFFLACLSQNSIDKQGFFQTEINEALDIWQKKQPDNIYLIPVRLDDSEVPDILNQLQWASLFEKEGWSQLLKSIQKGMEHRREKLINEKKGFLINLSKKLYIYPTIALYLGGSGIRCGKHFMKMRNTLPEEKQKLIEYFFIDSEKPDIEDDAASRQYFYKDLYKFQSNAYQPFWQERFPENLGSNPIFNSHEGCGTTRIFGAASIVSNIDNFFMLLDDAYNRLSSYRETERRLQIFITASACGGTGAGMLLDAAALIRHKFKSRGNPPVYLFLLGPDVFLNDPTIGISGDNKSRMKASAYALLKELHHFASGNPFRSSYRTRDERIQISNASESDRLFDWVYYINGVSPRSQDKAPKTLKYISWMVAETQFQICVSQIAQKVRQVMPYQREEKVKDFPDHYPHPAHRDSIDDLTRQIMQRQSRKAFLASFSTKTVCVPRQEIAEWLRQNWIVEAMEAMLGPEASYKEFDKLLGLHAYDGEEGLLSEWKLTDKAIKEAIVSWVAKDIEKISEIDDEMSYEAILSGAVPILADTEELIETRIHGVRTLSSEGNGTGAEENFQWLNTRFLNVTPIVETLKKLCWEKGKGLKWLNEFLNYLLDDQKGYLAEQSQKSVSQPDLNELNKLINEQKDNIESLLEERKNATNTLLKKLLWWGKYVINIINEGGTPPYGEELVMAIEDLPERLMTLREKTQETLSSYIYAQIRDAIYKEATNVFSGYRDNIISPIVPKIENAFGIAKQQKEHYRNLLRSLTFEKQDAYTTVHLIDDDILQAFKKRVEYRFSIPQKVIAPLLTPAGISFGTKRLNINTLLHKDMTGETILEMLSRHITEQTETALGFLKSWWSLEAFRDVLNECAAELDSDSLPFIDFDQSGVGARTLGWLLKPEDMILPKPFGTKVDKMESIPSQEPSSISVVSFVYGIPPNSLNHLHDMFLDYTRRLGDYEKARADTNRYPLHVFKEAHEVCDEPYSPVQLEFRKDEELARLLGIARDLGIVKEEGNEKEKDGEKKREIMALDIRAFEIHEKEFVQTLKANWNLVIELCEQILYQLRLQPDNQEAFKKLQKIPSLKALYQARQGRA